MNEAETTTDAPVEVEEVATADVVIEGTSTASPEAPREGAVDVVRSVVAVGIEAVEAAVAASALPRA